MHGVFAVGGSATMPESAEEAYHRVEDLDPSWEISQTLHSEGEQFPSMDKNF